MRTVARRPSFSAMPLVPLSAAFAAGVLAARLLEPTFAACLVCGLVAGALALCAFAGRRLAAASYLTIVAFAFAGTALGRAQNERA
ncbi:MAG TPA: hypothetical protein VM934_16310, partial [Pyrinomonadaceae bacterium]|nr:hypothetical protein [Pyrinomonadaceae bacterium]